MVGLRIQRSASSFESQMPAWKTDRYSFETSPVYCPCSHLYTCSLPLHFNLGIE
jgi:hypothetical protein